LKSRFQEQAERKGAGLKCSLRLKVEADQPGAGIVEAGLRSR